MSDHVLGLHQVHKSIAGRTLFAGVSMGLHAGQKVGLIGANGAGKSTLLKMLVHEELADAGQVTVRRDVRLHYLPQDPTFKQSTVGEVLKDSFAELDDIIKRYEEAVAKGREQADSLLHAIENLGGWSYEHKIDQVAAELRLPALDTPVQHLSGGQAKRLALAQQVLSNPDVLLLDEPTNHLDAETTAWLENWLLQTASTVLVVTHDRYFLDHVCDHMFDLRDGSLFTYTGNYTDYLSSRALEEAQMETLRHKRLRHLMSELEWARRSPKARTTKSNARLERIVHVQDEVQRLSGQNFQADFSFGKPPRLGGIILELQQLGMWFDESQPLLKNFMLSICKGERLGIVGDNGAGKSTLLKLIAGELQPNEGKVVLGQNTRVAYFDQQRSMLDLGATIKGTLTPNGGDHVFPDGKPTHVASWLDRFGFAQDTHRRVVGSLSGGERNRLALALLLLQDANVLLLDEPTNDLDIPTLNVLEESLASFAGCVLVVSHDRYFLDKIATGILAFDGTNKNAEVTHIKGNYSAYKEYLSQAADKSVEQVVLATPKTAAKKPVPAERKKKALTYGEEIELGGLEAKIEAADAEVSRLESRLADTALWNDDPKGALELQETLQTAKLQQTTLFDRWEELMRRSEGA